jgi:hypothetical protein
MTRRKGEITRDDLKRNGVVKDAAPDVWHRVRNAKPTGSPQSWWRRIAF